MSATAHIPQPPFAQIRAGSLGVVNRPLVVSLFVFALLHGLIYVFVLPPWQHYDEPKHFEYAAQIAAGDAGAATQARLSRTIADSMYRHNFWPPGTMPDLLGPAPVAIGENQRVHPPLYYTLVAAVIAPLRAAPIEWQLYAGRLLSLLLYAFTIIIFWRIAVVIVPEEPAMHLALPLLALLAPTFSDLMSAVNSDVLVNFAVAALLLGCALLIRDGPGFAGLALAVLGFGAALLTKRVAMVALVPFALAIFWAVRPRPLSWLAYLGGIGGAGLGLLLAGFHIVSVDGPAGSHLALLPRAWLAALDQAYLRINIAAWMASASDMQRSLPLYPAVLLTVSESFWTRLAWGHIELGGLTGMVVVGMSVLVGVVGVAIWMVKNRTTVAGWQYRWVVLCALAVIAALVSTVARLHPLPAELTNAYIPRGRYMFWAFLPVVWLIALGWQQLVPERWRTRGPYALLVLFAILDLSALLALVRMYY